MEQNILVFGMFWMLVSTSPAYELMDTALLKRIANVSYADSTSPRVTTSLFSPRMDFDQWKPLTGRGDPLRNDPTYDYEPPLLERVHYWADDTRLERERYPERKSEVLMLGVSSRKPSVPPHQSSLPPRRHHRPQPSKYEDFSYKIGENFPMTILVPPPPPQSGHQHSYYDVSIDKLPLPIPSKKLTEPTILLSTKIITTTSAPEYFTTLYSLQEANLIYQSSTTSQNWATNKNETKLKPDTAVSSEYAGWGPTTPLDETDFNNDTFNFIIHDYKDLSQHPYSFYKPMFSDAPPPSNTPAPFLPTILPSIITTTLPPPSTSPTSYSRPSLNKQETYQAEESIISEIPALRYQETTNEKDEKQKNIYVPEDSHKPEQNILEMLGPMMTMPLGKESDRTEDNLYVHGTANSHIFRDYKKQIDIQIDNMQTMQTPPVMLIKEIIKTTEQPYHFDPHIINNLSNGNGLDPYLNMRYPTSPPKTIDEDTQSIAEASAPMYLIIQGHSKVKTYSSKSNEGNSDTLSNKIPKSNEVKHLHPVKEKRSKKFENTDTNRKNGAKSLKSLVDAGVGSIEIQEADVGIKYDISDGSDVPIEVYRKGIVDSDENAYHSSKTKKGKEIRLKRQVDLEELLPFDEDTLEEYVYDLFNERRNNTGVTGYIAQAVTSDAAAELDDLEADDDDNEDSEQNEDEDR